MLGLIDYIDGTWDGMVHCLLPRQFNQVVSSWLFILYNILHTVVSYFVKFIVFFVVVAAVFD